MHFGRLSLLVAQEAGYGGYPTDKTLSVALQCEPTAKTAGGWFGVNQRTKPPGRLAPGEAMDKTNRQAAGSGVSQQRKPP